MRQRSRILLQRRLARRRPPLSAGGWVCGSSLTEPEYRSIRITGRIMIVADSSASRPKRTIRPCSGNLITVPTQPLPLPAVGA